MRAQRVGVRDTVSLLGGCQGHVVLRGRLGGGGIAAVAVALDRGPVVWVPIRSLHKERVRWHERKGPWPSAINSRWMACNTTTERKAA